MPTMHLTHIAFFPSLSFAVPFSRNTLTEFSMTLTRLSGTKSLRNPLVVPLLGEWVASSTLSKARWSEATEIGYAALTDSKQSEAVKQYASFLFQAPDHLGLLMDLNVRKVGFRAVSEYMSRWGDCIHGCNALSVPLAHSLPGPILGHMEGDGQAP